MSDEVQRPRPTSNEDRAGWNAYWAAQGMSWRSEPEIDEQQQRYLAERRSIQPDIEQGTYPFKGIKLDRADVEWLLATHESGGMREPVEWGDPKQRGREGLDLRGVDLRGANLTRMPLACLHAGFRLEEFAFSTPAQPELELEPTYAMTEGLRASVAHLEKAQLSGAHLEEALAVAANFEDAEIMGVHFEQANLLFARFGGSVLVGAHMENADLGGATFSDTSRLNGAWLGSRDDGLARLVDVR